MIRQRSQPGIAATEGRGFATKDHKDRKKNRLSPHTPSDLCVPCDLLRLKTSGVSSTGFQSAERFLRYNTSIFQVSDTERVRLHPTRRQRLAALPYVIRFPVPGWRITTSDRRPSRRQAPPRVAPRHPPLVPYLRDMTNFRVCERFDAVSGYQARWQGNK